MNYDWNFTRIAPYGEAFVRGTVVSIELTALAILLGTLLGIGLGLLMRSRPVRVLMYPAVDVVRAIPPLVLILFMYYFMTREVVGVTFPAFWVAVTAMSLNLTAFTSDLVRAAVENIPRDVLDAGRALGLSERQITKHIVVRHVVREIIPGMTVLYIGMLKMSSLASVINVREVVNSAQTVIAASSRSLEAWAVVAVIYVVLVVPASHLARRIERVAGRGAGAEAAPASRA